MAIAARNMTTSIIGNVGVIVYASRESTDEEWSTWLKQYREQASKLRAVMIYSLGGGPTGKQRAELGRVFQTLERIPPAYVLTSSIVARGITTAINWFLPTAQRAKMLPLEELEQVFVALDLNATARAEIKRTIETSLRSLAPEARAQR